MYCCRIFWCSMSACQEYFFIIYFPFYSTAFCDGIYLDKNKQSLQHVRANMIKLISIAWEPGPHFNVNQSRCRISAMKTRQLWEWLIFIMGIFIIVRVHLDIERAQCNHIYICMVIWVRSRNCGCLVSWFCYQLIAKPGIKTAAVL